MSAALVPTPNPGEGNDDDKSDQQGALARQAAAPGLALVTSAIAQIPDALRSLVPPGMNIALGLPATTSPHEMSAAYGALHLASIGIGVDDLEETERPAELMLAAKRLLLDLRGGLLTIPNAEGVITFRGHDGDNYVITGQKGGEWVAINLDRTYVDPLNSADVPLTIVESSWSSQTALVPPGFVYAHFHFVIGDPATLQESTVGCLIAPANLLTIGSQIDPIIRLRGYVSHPELGQIVALERLDRAADRAYGELFVVQTGERIAAIDGKRIIRFVEHCMTEDTSVVTFKGRAMFIAHFEDGTAFVDPETHGRIGVGGYWFERVEHIISRADGRTCASVEMYGDDNTQKAILDVDASGPERLVFATDLPECGKLSPSKLFFNADGELIVVGYTDNGYRMWNVDRRIVLVKDPEVYLSVTLPCAENAPMRFEGWVSTNGASSVHGIYQLAEGKLEKATIAGRSTDGARTIYDDQKRPTFTFLKGDRGPGTLVRLSDDHLVELSDFGIRSLDKVVYSPAGRAFASVRLRSGGAALLDLDTLTLVDDFKSVEKVITFPDQPDLYVWGTVPRCAYLRLVNLSNGAVFGDPTESYSEPEVAPDNRVWVTGSAHYRDATSATFVRDVFNGKRFDLSGSGITYVSALHLGPRGEVVASGAGNRGDDDWILYDVLGSQELPIDPRIQLEKYANLIFLRDGAWAYPAKSRKSENRGLVRGSGLFRPTMPTNT